MPDITMCRTNECPKRFDCVRAMAIPSTYQSVSNFYVDLPCENFWHIKDSPSHYKLADKPYGDE
jgi:hypothetical protein